MSNKFITTIAASFIALLPASAQQVETLPQQNLAKWHISPANYSGITRIDSSLYAVVDDKSSVEGFVLLSIDVDPQTGKIRQVTDKGTCHPARPDSLSFRADCEDLVYVPSSRTVFVAQENTGQVKEYTMQGELTGRALRIPESMSRAKQQWNGFEALAYHQPSQTFWLTTENSLKADAPADSKSRQLLRLNAFSSSLDSLCQRLYMMEAPRLKQGVKYYTHGVPAMTALPDGRLLVMERELSVPRRYLGGKCLIRIFVVDPAEAVQPGAVLTKREVAQFSTHIRIGSINYANYEGMCLGPQLADGRQTLLLVNDSQAGAGNAICKLKDYLKTIILPHNF